jgi:hypothetical protein
MVNNRASSQSLNQKFLISFHLVHNFNMATLYDIHLFRISVNLVKEGPSLVLSELHIEDPFILNVLRESFEEINLVQRNFQKDL